ncbi:MAG: VWA domain-containing protein [Desulfosalsimonadaceae bacterium]|nr:VWA domain-containing protein [Desulfosalsimonadaceae bacterium]
MGMKLQSIHMLFLLWAIPLVIGLYVHAAGRRRRLLKRFVDAGMIAVLQVSASPAKRRWKAAGVIGAMILIIIGTARPSWNLKPETIERRGRDVVFLLDVSKSMLAEDLQPSRLERAKLAISDCIDVLEGDRVALVAFAGTAVVKCPLTLDYGFFRMMVEDISTDSISRGGTLIGDALRTILSDVFDDSAGQSRDIVLITDGEDQDSFPEEAAKLAGERGIRLIAVGIGDENEGRRIPMTNEKGETTFLKYNGQEVWSRLDADTLRKMALATPGGKYLNVATGAIDMGKVYQSLILSADRKDLKSETLRRYDEKFQIFLALALLLLIAEMAVGDRKKEKATHETV